MKERDNSGKRGMRLVGGCLALIVFVQLTGILYGARLVYGEAKYSGVTAIGETAIAVKSPLKREEDRSKKDKTAPVLTLIGITPMSVEWNSMFIDPGAAAVDDVDGILPVQVTGYVRTDNAGTYVLTYSATDNSGNMATKTREVRVNEFAPSPPVKSIVIHLEEGDKFIDGGGTTSGGDCSFHIPEVNELSPNAEAMDTTVPAITLLGVSQVTVEGGDLYVDEGAAVVDNVGGCSANTVTNSVNMYEVGWYKVTYKVTDAGVSLAEAARSVHVTDTVAPHLALVGPNPLRLDTRDKFVDPGAIATDRMDGRVAVTVEGKVNMRAAGTYTLTYYTSDRSGNKAEISRDVIVTAAPAKKER